MTRTRAGLPKLIAMRAHLQPLRHWREPKLGGNGAAIPRHERRADFENPLTIDTHHLGDLRSTTVAVRAVELFAGADIDFAEQRALGHDRQRTIHGRA